MSAMEMHSVSDITRIIKLLIEENIPAVWVEGEISNFKKHYSGHLYFTLKDENAQISAVIWKSRTSGLQFDPEDGMLVQALGTVRLYEKSGRYQLDIIRIQQAGAGRLQLAFEQLKQKLDAEGLFDPSLKKEIPKFPEKIGIVTSGTGAAINDITNIIHRRAPHVQLILRSAKVQGEGAAQDIADAIREFNEDGKADVLIVGRGGGSLEDLWAFNEEIVARAIHDSEIPVISAVGHEIDFTIADFVADLRAPTPSAAAELSVPDSAELQANILFVHKRLKSLVQSKIDIQRDKITNIYRSYGFKRPLDTLRQYSLQVDDLSNKLTKSVINVIKENREYCNQLSLRLKNLDPGKVLERGFSISFAGNKIIRDIKDIKINEKMRTEISNGSIISSVVNKDNKRNA
jgi:exodeoxyribonuclease VII large subunit